MFVIRELPFCYKARRMEGVSSKGVTLLLEEFHMLLEAEGVWNVSVT